VAELLQRNGPRDEAREELKAAAMNSEVSLYLDEVKSHLHLDSRTERRVINELSTHFQEKVDDLEEQGVAEAEATRVALASFGNAHSIARLMYEAYSRGTWTEALISCQPHLILAALFATHVWRHPVFLGVAFAAIVVIALLGWRQGSPTWTYSWVGYALLPLLVLSYLSMDPVARSISHLLSGQGVPAPVWQLVVLAVLYAFTLWLIASAAITVARRDWILLSLMLLPLPVLGIWVISVTQAAGFLPDALRSLEARFSRWDGAMAYFFTVLGVTTALFVRLRQRALKLGAIVAVGIVGGAAAANSIWGELGLVRLVAVSLCLLLFLYIPFVLHSLLGRDQKSEAVLPS
jgi:hypothetical protein